MTGYISSMRQLAESRAALAGHLPEKIAAAVYEFITTTLLEDPRRVGKRLILPPFEGTWSARRGTYRVLQEIDEADFVVTVTAIEHRADAYRSR
jgi:mRNA interferase RelE/StbE